MSHNKGSDKDSFYDSGRADSGFLSGALNSETLLSGEIQPEDEDTFQDVKGTSSRIQPDQSMDKNQSKDDYMRLDSGVDLVSDQMSDLYIEEEPEIPSVQISLAVQAADKEEPSCQLYFQQDDEGDTQLHIAIIHGLIEVVFNLVRMVPSPEYLNIRNDMRQTALHLAVLTSQPRILRRLIVAGADPGHVDRNGNTALHLATYASDAQCVCALTEKVAPHEVSAAQLRFKPTCPRKIPSLADMVNYEGLTSVHVAALSDDFGILKHLVRYCEADIDAREGKAGRTVLHMAAEIGNDDLAVLLLRDLKADPEMPNYAGRTAYQVGRRNPHFLKTLDTYGATAVPEYFTSDEEDDDDIDDLQSFDNGFRDLVGQGRLINAA